MPGKNLTKKILVITDNLFIYENFKKIASKLRGASFIYRFSPGNKYFLERFASSRSFRPINVRSEYPKIIKIFNLVVSAHSRQLFPAEMVKNIKCINIHPGYNPYNRGWAPQVFSIINKLPAGVTIHEIDEKIDHGRIIDQVEIPLYPWDTSTTAYKRIQKTEIGLIKKNLGKIVAKKYRARKPAESGNLNLKKDFDKLRELDLDRVANFGTFIDLLRALTHEGYNNAFFTDKKTGKKIFVSINLRKDE
jgi:methionyl-tRNA formyltransferase